MTRPDKTLAAITFSCVVAVLSVARLAQEILSLGNADDKLGNPMDQFQLMSAVHLIAVGIATFGFTVGTNIPGTPAGGRRSVALCLALGFGVVIGLLSPLRLGEWFAVLTPLSHMTSAVVASLLAGVLAGLGVRVLSTTFGSTVAV